MNGHLGSHADWTTSAARPVVAQQLAARTDFRLTLHSNGLAHVENSSVSGHRPPPSGFESRYQVVLPYSGLFAYHVGNRHWMIDTNKTLLVSPGWEYQDEHPVDGLGHAAIVINPGIELIEEWCGNPARGKGSPFSAVALQAPAQLTLLTHWMLRHGQDMDDVLQKDEWVVLALQAAVEGRPPGPSRSSQFVSRAKEVLHACSFDRLSLGDIARQVGASPVYLTQEFTRCEGVPLYQYQLALRLRHALNELAHCDNITQLALDLGFSSHSHFATAFRKCFGVTPSQYRQSATRPNVSEKVSQFLSACSKSRRRAA